MSWYNEDYNKEKYNSFFSLLLFICLYVDCSFMPRFSTVFLYIIFGDADDSLNFSVASPLRLQCRIQESLTIFIPSINPPRHWHIGEMLSTSTFSDDNSICKDSNAQWTKSVMLEEGTTIPSATSSPDFSHLKRPGSDLMWSSKILPFRRTTESWLEPAAPRPLPPLNLSPPGCPLCPPLVCDPFLGAQHTDAKCPTLMQLRYSLPTAGHLESPVQFLLDPQFPHDDISCDCDWMTLAWAPGCWEIP